MLRCPKCHAPLLLHDRTFRCENHHCYDQAKQGYANLLIHSRRECGDNKEMVRARSAFLAQGYYACLRRQLCEIVSALPVHSVVDAGCGEGYYTNAIQAAAHCEMIGFDMSKYALMKSAKGNPQVRYFAASIFDMPLEDACCDLVLSVFAPFAKEEFCRVLKAGGYVLKVEPGARHLYGLKELLYEQVYENEAQAAHYEGLLLRREWLVEDVIEVRGQEMLQALFQMTPYCYRSPRAGVERLAVCERLCTEVQFHIELYQKSTGTP